MKKAWNVILVLALSLLVLGAVCFVLAILLGSDLVRISDAVFARYDLTQTIINVQNLILRIRSIF
jgi:hypothetical protein